MENCFLFAEKIFQRFSQLQNFSALCRDQAAVRLNLVWFGEMQIPYVILAALDLVIKLHGELYWDEIAFLVNCVEI